MELLAIIVALIGPVLLVGGFIGWWRWSAYLTPEEHIADVLHRYEQEVDKDTYTTITNLLRIREEHGDDARGSGT
jgi:hypothetical protein